MTENILETSISNWSLNNLLNNITKERLIYLGVFVVLVGAIIYYLKYVRNSQKLLNTQNFNNELVQPPQQYQQPQPPQQYQQPQPPQQYQQPPQQYQQPPQMEYPKKIMMELELFEDLKRKNMTPQDYIFELQKAGQFPPGPMPEIVIDNQNLKRVEQSHNIQNNQKKENNLNDLKLDEDEESNDEDGEDNEDDNLREENLSKEEMDNIREQLLKLQKTTNK
jgi:hypothetical protein